MSFKFNWDSFNDENFYERARALLTDALNKGKMPPILSDRIIVRELYLGEESPQLEILEVGDLADDRFRGIFKLTYNGEASITLATKVQANPLKVYSMSAPSFCTPKFMGASAPLDIPLNLTLSDIRLSGIIILVFSKAKGLTLVFRNDPLQSIRVSSTFDALPGIARFLQGQIENQIRSLFREELPAILHRLSHRWTPSGGLVLHKGVAGPTTSKNTTNNTHNETGVASSAENLDTESNGETKIAFMEINPDMPVLSSSNMLKINTLSASQQTLSLFTPALPETVYRANLEQSEERYSAGNIQSLAGGASDLDEIARIQSRNYFRNSHASPKRRVIKLNNKSNNNTNNKQSNEHPSTSDEKVDTTLPLSSVETKSPLPDITQSYRNSLLIPKQQLHLQQQQPQSILHSRTPSILVGSEKEPIILVQGKSQRTPSSKASLKKRRAQQNTEFMIPPPPAYVA